MAITTKKNRAKKLDPAEMVFSGTAGEDIIAGELVSRNAAGEIISAVADDYGMLGTSLDSVSDGYVVQYINGNPKLYNLLNRILIQ